jgi:hypothetical protein
MAILVGIGMGYIAGKDVADRWWEKREPMSDGVLNFPNGYSVSCIFADTDEKIIRPYYENPDCFKKGGDTYVCPPASKEGCAVQP